MSTLMDKEFLGFTTSQLEYYNRLYNKSRGALNCPCTVKITRQNSSCHPPVQRLCVCLCVYVCKEGDQASSADSFVC